MFSDWIILGIAFAVLVYIAAQELIFSRRK